MTDENSDKIAQLTDFIMKKCLWQFHSRAWDRERQNTNILGMTSRLICGEEVAAETLEDRCYWVDARYMADAFTKRFSWLTDMSMEDKKELMQGVKERIDYLTITGSLNEELTDTHY
ncbi:MAG TPA: Fe-only nitrogenase subunit delta [Syntrophomonas sp.]|jgi:nitrogenase delta subunit|nr:Fe-only nitrogenase subunit delta [Syntrophomonas sp.]